MIYIIYVDDTTDNKVLGVINQAMNPNTNFKLKPNRSMSYQHLAKGSSVPFSSDSQQYNDTNKLSDLRKNNKTKTKGTKIQRAIKIVESSLDDSLVVEEAIKTEEDGNNFDTGTDTEIDTTGTNSISNDNSYSITKPEKIFTVKSKTDKSKFYTVNIENNTCTCADFSYRKSICKHIIAAKLLSIY